MMSSYPTRPLRLALLACALLLLSGALSGCGRNMYNQAKYGTYDQSNLFENGTSSRPLIDGTVSRKRGGTDASFFTGVGENGLLTELPIPLTYDVLERGQERYNIYCSPCHNFSGYGGGHDHPKRLRAARVVSRRTPPGAARRLLLQRHHQRLWQDVSLRVTDSARGPLGHLGLHQGAATESKRDAGRCARRRFCKRSIAQGASR